MTLTIQIIIGAVLFLFGLLFILAIVGGKRCPDCDRHKDDEPCICEQEENNATR